MSTADWGATRMGFRESVGRLAAKAASIPTVIREMSGVPAAIECGACGDDDDNTNTLVTKCNVCGELACDECWEDGKCHKPKGQKND